MNLKYSSAALAKEGGGKEVLLPLPKVGSVLGETESAVTSLEFSGQESLE
jgi:hypothetical protein